MLLIREAALTREREREREIERERERYAGGPPLKEGLLERCAHDIYTYIYKKREKERERER